MGNMILCSNIECKRATFCLRHLAVTVSSRRYSNLAEQGCKEPTYYSFLYPDKEKTLSLVSVRSIWKEKLDGEFKRK